MLIDNSGVRCDMTGEILKGDFVYYSITGVRVHIVGDKATPYRDTLIDMDICEAAFQTLINRCRPFVGQMVQKGSLKCELSGATLSGEFDYWHLVIDKIVVPTSKADQKNGDVPIEVVNGVLDLNICQAEGDKMLETKASWRKAPMPS